MADPLSPSPAAPEGVAAEWLHLPLDGLEIAVPSEPPSPEVCPVQSRIECAEGLWTIDVWKEGQLSGSHGPETFTSALFRALMKQDLGESEPDRIVLRWIA